MGSANYTKISGFSGLLFSLFSEAIKHLGLNILMLKMDNYTVEKPDNTLTEWSKLAAPIRTRGQHAPPDATFWEGQNIIYLNRSLITRETKPKLKDILSSTWLVFLKNVNYHERLKKLRKFLRSRRPRDGTTKLRSDPQLSPRWENDSSRGHCWDSWETGI